MTNLLRCLVFVGCFNGASLITRISSLFLLLPVFCPITQAAEKPAESYRVLFLGNSRYVANGGPLQAFEGFCRAEGLVCEAVNQRGGERDRLPLKPVTHGIEFAGLGRINPYIRKVANDERVRALITSGQFNYVVIHTRPGDFVPDSLGNPDKVIDVRHKDLHRLIVESDATTVISMTHVNSQFFHLMHIVAEAHRRLKEELNAMAVVGGSDSVILVPTGLFWLDAKEKFGVEAWYEDPIHASKLGQYGTGAIFYTYLTGRDPRQNAFADLPSSWQALEGILKKSTTPAQAEWIKNLVWWYYSKYR